MKNCISSIGGDIIKKYTEKTPWFEILTPPKMRTLLPSAHLRCVDTWLVQSITVSQVQTIENFLFVFKALNKYWRVMSLMISVFFVFMWIWTERKNNSFKLFFDDVPLKGSAAKIIFQIHSPSKCFNFLHPTTKLEPRSPGKKIIYFKIFIYIAAYGTSIRIGWAAKQSASPHHGDRHVILK